jgi:D-alanyl-D-alanine carboxypeptidase
MADFYESLAALAQRLAQARAQVFQPQPMMDPMAGGGMGMGLGGGDPVYGGLFGIAQQSLGGGGMPGSMPMPGGGTSGFVPTGPSGSALDYGFNPRDLVTAHGITGVPAGVRRLLQGARATGLTPGAISEAVMGEGFRSHEEQAALYQQHLAGQHPAPVAPPGHSMHEIGRAWDISTSFLDQHPEYRRWLLGHGFEFPVTGEPWHAEWQGRLGTWQPGRPVAPSRPSVPTHSQAPQHRTRRTRPSTLPSSSLSAAALAARRG